jgi:hypothetical protein
METPAMIRKTTNILTNEHGAALVIALMMMIMLTLVGLGSIFTSTFEVKLSGNKRASTNAFTDPANPNPTNARVVNTYIPDQYGSPRASGFSAAHFEFLYFTINSAGEDRIDLSPVKSACIMEEKVVRLVPTLQGGY